MTIDPKEMMRALRLYADRDRCSVNLDSTAGVDWSISLHLCFGFASDRQEATAKTKEVKQLWDGVKGKLNSNSLRSGPNIDLDWRSLELKPYFANGHWAGKSHVYWAVDLMGLARGHSANVSDANDDQLRWVESNWKPLINSGVYDFMASVNREI